ncbi:hypothetical protein ACE1TF_13840 [Geomicrobium sp. JSM 1781026]
MNERKGRLLNKFKCKNTINHLVIGTNLKNGKPYVHYVYETEKTRKEL